MPRPTNKEDLLFLADAKYHQLMQLIEQFSEQEQLGIFPFDDRDRNIRDVLAHLYEWQNMLIKWYSVGMKGEKAEIPASGFSWKMTPALNKQIWQHYQDTDLAKCKSWLENSHKKMLTMINLHTQQELYELKQYAWTRTTTLSAYFVSATSSHYDWAIKKIKKYQRTLKSSKRSKITQ